jgi:hypothetical protein
VATNERQSCILPDGFKVIDAAIARTLALDFEETGKALNAMAKRCEVLQELNDTLRRRNITLMDERDTMSNSCHATNKERLELKDKLANERTISDCLAGAISGTFDYSEAISRYNASLQLPRNGIPPVNIFTRRDGAP